MQLPLLVVMCLEKSSLFVGVGFGTGRVHVCYLCARISQQETSYDVTLTSGYYANMPFLCIMCLFRLCVLL